MRTGVILLLFVALPTLVTAVIWAVDAWRSSAKNVLTVLRRELGAYLKSAIGYIFIVVFLVVSVGIFIWPFFAYPVASMRQFFSLLPIFLCVFIPAVTMRLWAQERSDNTYEMLLTFPMKAGELVLGKYLAGLGFYAAALGGTLTVPLTLAWLGDPDGWAIFGAYLGAFLIGAQFLAVGVLVSAFFRDQIIAFLITMLITFGMYLTGTTFIAAFLDGWAVTGADVAGWLLPTAGYALLLALLCLPLYRRLSKYTYGESRLMGPRGYALWALAGGGTVRLVQGLFFAGDEAGAGGGVLAADSGLGTLLSNLVGVTNHYEAFTKGVVDLSDVVFFLVWVTVFLILNCVYLDIRGRPRGRQSFAIAGALLLGIGLLTNWLLTDVSLARFDLTEDRLYTVSDAGVGMLAKLDVPVQVNVYITPRSKMPTELKSLEQDILDKLEELRVASGSKVRFRSIHMEAANIIGSRPTKRETPTESPDAETAQKESLEDRLRDKGVRPFPVRSVRKGEVANQLVYSSLGVAYKDKPEEIVPHILPQVLTELEYQVISTAYRLSEEREPVVALFAPDETVTISPAQRRVMEEKGQKIPASEDPYAQLEDALRGEKYDVRRVLLTRDSPIPGETETLLVVEPKDLSQRQLWEINRFLAGGGNVFIASQQYTMSYRTSRQGVQVTARPTTPCINDVLEPSGLTVDTAFLMDKSHGTLTLTGRRTVGRLTIQAPMPYKIPTHIVINPATMNRAVPVTARVGSVFYLWGSAVEMDAGVLQENGVRVTTLMSTSENSWRVARSAGLTGADFNPSQHQLQSYPVMVLAEGTFPDAFAGEDRPEWPKAPDSDAPADEVDGADAEADEEESEPPTPKLEAKPGRLILLGGAHLFRKDFFKRASAELWLNVVDTLTLNPELIKIRGRKPIERVIERPSDRAVAFWKFVNLALVNLLVAGVGIVGSVVRQHSRNAYTLAHVDD